ncbi:hypothetical protein [Glycomyces sp. YM15]|uniref:hypothetical protein n=1 Tax=Glycomyces sp. YM15 TaxID=2800446 RepID=UPI00196241BC|nr:hypothetical protein [Glycomyces sp. YM15]
MNLVDDTRFTRPLAKALTGHVDAFQRSMAGPASVHGALEAARPAAVAWVYYTVLIAWAEDHGLIDPWLRKEAVDARDAVLAGGIPPTGWIAMGIGKLTVHPATWCLLDPRYSELRAGTPGETEALALLDWWAAEAPSLRYDVDKGPASITGWLPGDLLQALSAERRKQFAFCQTPWWVADFLLDRTLVPAVDEFRHEPVIRSIDPTCGTGHILARTVDYLWEWYTTGALRPRQATGGFAAAGGTVLEPADAIRRILAGVHGCEKDPLTAAVARLRMTVIVGDLMHRSGMISRLRLDALPPFEPVIAVGDSLLAGIVTEAEYATVHPRLADIQNLGVPGSVGRPRV